MNTLRTKTLFALCALLSLTAFAPRPARAQLFADAVQYSGTFDLSANALYSNPNAALNRPTTLDDDGFDPPYHACLVNPAYGKDVSPHRNALVALGSDGKGALTVTFSTPITHSDAHWYGQDFVVYTNSFFTGSFPDGTPYFTEGDHLSQYQLDGGVYGSLPTVSVSSDGVHYVVAHTPDALVFPANPYHWAGITQSNPSGWGALQNFAKPVSPALTASDFTGVTGVYAVNTLYAGSAGGVSYSLSGTGLTSIKYIRFTGLGNIDGVSRVGFPPAAPSCQ